MNKKGFTLIELLVVIVIIGILVAIALPNFIRIKDKAKEAEVKQNCHAIQLSLERYAVDSSAGDYPMFVMGGDWTDSYVVWQEWVDLQPNLEVADIVKYTFNGNWEPAIPAQGDALVMEAYMPSYPGNPFIKNKSATLLPVIEHFACWGHGTFTRYVGGRESDKMAEVFGPQVITGTAGEYVVGDYYVHHIFNNPPYDTLGDQTKSGGVDYNAPSGNSLLVGNWSYYGRPTEEDGIFPSQQRQDVMGYTIAGYGSVRTPGQDVYNRNGNYKGRYRTTGCDVDCSSGDSNFFGDDIPCICPGDNSAPSHLKNNGGSDTLSDGVVVTLDSGVDQSSKRVNIGTTEGS